MSYWVQQPAEETPVINEENTDQVEANTPEMKSISNVMTDKEQELKILKSEIKVLKGQQQRLNEAKNPKEANKHLKDIEDILTEKNRIKRELTLEIENYKHAETDTQIMKQKRS